jgi:hypothetical protein
VFCVGVVATALMLVNVVAAPTVARFAELIAARGPVIGSLIVVILLIWTAVSIGLFALAARASARRFGGIRTRSVAAIRDVLWATCLVALGGSVPLSLRALMQYGTGAEQAAWLDWPNHLAIGLALGLTAAVMTFVSAIVPEHR